jgi:predicted hydrocarbon binding protein
LHGIVSKGLTDFVTAEYDRRVVGDDRVKVTSASERELCAVGKGLLAGIGYYDDEWLAVEEPTCMLDGGDHCEPVVER